jgi:hypothetical protein
MKLCKNSFSLGIPEYMLNTTPGHVRKILTSESSLPGLSKRQAEYSAQRQLCDPRKSPLVIKSFDSNFSSHLETV